MIDFFSTLSNAALQNNLVLIQLLGVSAFFANSARLRPSLEFAQVAFVVMVMAGTVNLVLHYFLLAPMGLELLRLPAFAVTGSTIAASALLLLRRRFYLAARRQDLGLLLFGGSSAVVGTSLLAPSAASGVIPAWGFILGSALGYGLLLVLFAALRERLDGALLPRAFRGAPSYLISAGVVSLCLMLMEGP